MAESIITLGMYLFILYVEPIGTLILTIVLASKSNISFFL